MLLLLFSLFLYYYYSFFFNKIIIFINFIIIIIIIITIVNVTPHLIKYVKLKECHEKDNIKARSGSFKLNFIQPMAHHDAQKKLEEKLTRVHESKDEQIHG